MQARQVFSVSLSRAVKWALARACRRNFRASQPVQQQCEGGLIASNQLQPSCSIAQHVPPPPAVTARRLYAGGPIQ